MLKMTAYLICNIEEKIKVTAFCELLNVTWKELQAESNVFGCYRIKGKKIDVLTFFHQAGRQLKSVVPSNRLSIR